MLKTCGQCKEEKELTEFWKDKTKKDGLQWRCIQCMRKPPKKKIAKSGFKFCGTCKEEKELTEFHKDKNRKGGVRGCCKVCALISAKNRYDNDPEKFREKTRQYAKNNPEKIKQYYLDNREQILDKHKQYRIDNNDLTLEYSRQYYIENKERERKRKYFKTPQGKMVLSKSRHKRRIAIAKGGEFTELDIITKFGLQNCKCLYCGKDIDYCDRSTWHIEHATPLSRGGSNYPENINITCPQCNLRKHTKTHEEFIEHLQKIKE